ncbi:hypothetical protein ACQP1W_17145 [Spirillospora sp. CA-255316]
MDSVTRGLVAGAAGTTALNAVAYLDMAVRGRPASSTPEQSVQRLAEAGGIGLGDDPDRAENRKAGLGPLLGYGTGLGMAMVYGLVARHRRVPRPAAGLAMTGLAMLGSNVPLTALGLTDPRQWTLKDWMSDILPHLAYGVVAAGVYEALR